MIALLLACRPSPPAAPVPTNPTWFDVEPGKPLCVSRFPDAAPLSPDDLARFEAAVASVVRGEYAAAVDGLAGLPGGHPAVDGALALVGLLVGQPEAPDALLRVSDEHPGDACALVGAALAAGAKGDVQGAADRVLRARHLAPETGNVAALSWYMDLEPSAVLRPVLERALAAEPDNAGVAFALGIERQSAGEDGAPLLEQALAAGVDVAAGPLLLAYRRAHRRADYLELASRIGLLFDDGGVAAAADPEVAFDALVGRAAGEHLQATLHTSMGDLTCALLSDVAPITVAAFVGLSRGTVPWIDPRDGQPKRVPLYDGTAFHRVIPEFMVQGGDPLGSGQGGPGWQIPDEVDPEVRFDGPGVLAMANAGPNTNGSQFFVTEVPIAHLDGRHTIFGRCDDASVDVVKRIARVPTGPGDQPVEAVRLEHVVVASVP